METTLVRSGCACPVLTISSWSPPFPLYGRKTPSPAALSRFSAALETLCSLSSTPWRSIALAWPSVR